MQRTEAARGVPSGASAGYPVLTLSPVTQIIQDARWLLITPHTVTTSDTLHLPWVLVPYLLPLIILWVGYSYFNRAAAAFAEEI